MGATAVERIALMMQLPQLGERIAHLQQRPRRVVAQAAEEVFGCGTQIEHRRASMQELPVALPEYSTTTGGKHTVTGAGDQLRNDLGLDITEGLLSVSLEELLDAATDALLDLVVRIDKRHADLACQLFADGGLATAGHADERELQVHIQGQLLFRLTVKVEPVTVPLGDLKLTDTKPEAAVSKE